MAGSVSLTTLAGYAAVASGALSVFNTLSGSSKGGSAAVAPAVPGPTKLPTPEDTGRAAEKASLAQMAQRRGRASTILTGETSDTLGA